jgi:LDH2 family malate/lactate/ureidoglycolate dehydrogenase
VRLCDSALVRSHEAKVAEAFSQGLAKGQASKDAAVREAVKKAASEGVGVQGLINSICFTAVLCFQEDSPPSPSRPSCRTCSRR